MACRGELHVDAVIHADTGDESVETYAHAKRIKELGLIPIIERSAGRISEDLMRYENTTWQRFVTVPFFISNRRLAEQAKSDLKAGVDPTYVMSMFAESIVDPGSDNYEDGFDDMKNGSPFKIGLMAQWKPEIIRNNVAYLVAQIDKYTSIGQTRRQCTKEYKVDVVDRTIRRELLGLKPKQRIPNDVTVTQLIGISTDEFGRSLRIKRRFEESRQFKCEFPLLNIGMSRTDCIKWLTEHYSLHVPSKSSCVFCPYHDQKTWRSIRANAEDWEAACKLDDAIRKPGRIVNRNFEMEMFVHRSCVPLRDANLDDPPKRTHERGLFDECEGMCGN
jgi:hypothetical protein